MSLLSRALFDDDQQPIADSLSARQREAVKEALSKSAKEIRELKQAANDHRASAALSTIESNIANAANTERKFGHAVMDLLQLFEIPDVGILGEYYKTHPRGPCEVGRE